MTNFPFCLIKCISSYDEADFQEKLDNVIDELDTEESQIVDVKFSTSASNDNVHFAAIVIYVPTSTR